MRFTRRSVLGSCLVAAVGASGCLSGSNAPTTPQVGAVTALNFQAEPRTLHLAIQRSDGTTAYEEAVSLAAGDPRDPSGVTVDSVPESPSSGTLRAWVGDKWSSGDGRFEFAGREGCIDVSVKVGRYGDPDVDQVAISTGNCQ